MGKKKQTKPKPVETEEDELMEPEGASPKARKEASAAASPLRRSKRSRGEGTRLETPPKQSDDDLMHPFQNTSERPRSTASKSKEEEPSAPLRRSNRPRGEGTRLETLTKPVETEQSGDDLIHPFQNTSERSRSNRRRGEGTEEKKAFPHLVWSKEDEIVVLQGLIDFKADTGKSYEEDKDGFCDSVLGSITIPVTNYQLTEKVRNLRRKYTDQGKTFTKAHDLKCLQLSNCIWGSDVNKSIVKTNKTEKKKEKKVEEEDKKVLFHGGTSESLGVRSSDWFEQSFLVGSVARFGVDEHFVKQRWSMVPTETKKKLEEKWKLLQDKEFKFVLEKTAFLNEMTCAMGEATTRTH